MYTLVSLCLLLCSAAAAASSDPPLDPLPAWSYECRHNVCVKVLVPDTNDAADSTAAATSLVSLAVCRLLCPVDPGTVWPKVRGSIDLHTGQLGAINPDEIRLSAAPVLHHPDFWPQNRERFVRQLRNKVPAGSRHVGHSGQAQSVRIQVLVASAECQIWRPKLDESYRIAATKVSDEGGAIQVVINATTIFGARHGLETLSQLVVFDDIRRQLLMPTDLRVADAPAFEHRGLLLDTSRNYFSVESIKRTIDGMALTKLNTFHWHITDSHSFPLVLASHPEFARLGAYTADQVYTAEQIASILDYAYVRGVRVLPEFDAPAHVGEGWQRTNLTVCFNQQPWAEYCVEPPCGQLNPTRDALYPVLGDIYAEMFRLFRSPGLFHMGGDEVSVACWNSSAEIRDWMQGRGWSVRREADFMRLWGHFQERALQRVDAAHAASNGGIDDAKVPIVMWTSRLTDVPFVDDYLDRERYIIQIWTTGADPKVADLLDRGYRLIMSNYDALYLDCGFGAWVAEGQNWCSPYIGWEKVYQNDWRDVAPTAERRARILGAEAALWSEEADEQVLDGRFWPRASALAERLWSDPEQWSEDGNGGATTVLAWRAAEPRMLLHRERLVQNGLAAESLQPQWCQQNEGECPIKK